MGIDKSSVAYRKGQSAARKCHAMERRNIIVAADNPYVRDKSRSNWQRGFIEEYFNRESSNAQ